MALRSLPALTLAGLLLSACTVHRAIREGDQWMEKQHPKAAIRAYQSGVEKKPDHAGLQLRLAEAYLAAGEAGVALAHARAAYEAGEDGGAEVLALALVRTHQWQEAIPLLMDALLDSDDPALYAILAEARMSTGQIDLAIESAVEARGSSASTDALVAYLLARDGRTEEAKELALATLAASPGSPDVLADLAVALYLAGAETGARAAAADAAQLVGDRGAAWAEAARIEHAAGALEGAIRLGMRAYMVDPGAPQAAWTAGIWWLEAGEPERAVTLLMQAYRHPDYALPGDSEVGVVNLMGLPEADRRAARYAIAVALADAFHDLDSPRDEIQMLSEAVGVQPTGELYLRLSEALMDAGRVPEANQAAQRALQYEITDGALATRLARSYATMGDGARALKFATIALEATPGDPELTLIAAAAYENLGDLPAALRLVEAALATHPEHTDLLMVRDRLRHIMDL